MKEKTMQKSGPDARMKKTLVIGALLGTFVGVAAAYVYLQNIQSDEEASITPGDGVKLGVLVFGLLRSIASLGEGK
jgi:hypothetical protein